MEDFGQQPARARLHPHNGGEKAARRRGIALLPDVRRDHARDEDNVACSSAHASRSLERAPASERSERASGTERAPQRERVTLLGSPRGEAPRKKMFGAIMRVMKTT